MARSFWLLSTFPFDFAHFANMFPSSDQPPVRVVSNDIGRFLFFLGGVGSVINFTYTAVPYSAVIGQSLRERTDNNLTLLS